MPSRLFWRKRRTEFAPLLTRAGETNRLSLSRGSNNPSNDVAGRQRLPAGFHDVALQSDGLPRLWLFRRIVKPHGLALRHVPLVSHPTHHLAPEPVMIF